MIEQPVRSLGGPVFDGCEKLNCRPMPQELKPHKVTKPIQLLAAWLLGLVLIDGTFLGAAKALSTPAWLPVILVIAAICNVPLFLVCIFLLQTRFRPQMQEDVFYSRYLRIQQETGKVRFSGNEIAELREATAASHDRLSEGLTKLDGSIVELRSKLSGLQSGRDREVVEGALVHSEQVLNEVRRGVQWAGHRVQVNDLLQEYGEIRRTLTESQIKITGTFGSTSDNPMRPAYPVISFGFGIGGAAILQICQLLRNSADWYINIAEQEISFGLVYIGAYGYGGEPLARLDDDLLKRMSGPGFAWSDLKEWIDQHPVYLDADYPRDPPE